MKTEIFENYEQFLERTDKSVNGVTQEFLDKNPESLSENENLNCWNCSECISCISCSHCIDCRDCRGCGYCKGCINCSYCSECSYCRDCIDCSYCSECIDCSYCRDCRGCGYCKSSGFKSEIPVIENIHQKVLDTITKAGNSLVMSNWHTCETSHCRAGWIVFLAGEDGKKLEEETSTIFASMQIVKKSSTIKIPLNRYFQFDNKLAIEDIKRCAKEEREICAKK